MKNNYKYKKKIFYSLLIFIIHINAASLFAVEANIKIITTVNSLQRFEGVRIHPEDYIWVRSWEKKGSYGIQHNIYNLNTHEIIKLPDVKKLMPPAPKMPKYRKGKIEKYKSDLTKFRFSGKYWHYTYHTTGDLVFYNPEKQTAGFIFSIKYYKRDNKENPICADGSKSEFIKEVSQYYCKNMRQFVPENQYIIEENVKEYVKVDLKSKRIISRTKIPIDGPIEFQDSAFDFFIGTDISEKYLYYYYWVKDLNNKLTVYIRGVNLETGEIEKKNQIPLLFEVNKESSFYTYGKSSDFSKFIFWQKNDNKKPNQSKARLIYIVSLSNFDVQTVPIEGDANKNSILFLDSNGKYLIDTEYDTGNLIKYDLIGKKVDIKTRVSEKIFDWVYHKKSDHIYGFSQNHIEVRNFNNFNLLKIIKYENIFPDIAQDTSILSHEPIFKSLSGDKAAIGILKQSGSSATSNMNDGFHIIQFTGW
ncbi:MAG: hypothetical protein OEZ13_00185 [Spirochaetia bacterium]|nr:hypothetical protein [Spirochaetia bacterium]